ncbi:MAG: hypothetical protein WC635_14860 [Bacteriovorax sp.]
MKIKKILPIMIAVLATLTACDSPRSKRSISSGVNSLSNTPAPINWSNPATGSTGTTGTTTTGSTGSTSIIPTDANHCKFAADGVTGFESNSSHLGDYTLCQSSTDKNLFYFQLKTAPTNSSGDVSICFIPTTSNGTNSIYVGNPMCGYFKNAKDVRKINFIKYPEYSNANINGVIFFKDLSWYYYNSYSMTLEAYKTCMNMLAAGNPTYCERFKSVGQYVYKQY